jgi:hypothetical protein
MVGGPQDPFDAMPGAVDPAWLPIPILRRFSAIIHPRFLALWAPGRAA